MYRRPQGRKHATCQLPARQNLTLSVRRVGLRPRSGTPIWVRKWLRLAKMNYLFEGGRFRPSHFLEEIKAEPRTLSRLKLGSFCQKPFQ